MRPEEYMNNLSKQFIEPLIDSLIRATITEAIMLAAAQAPRDTGLLSNAIRASAANIVKSGNNTYYVDLSQVPTYLQWILKGRNPGKRPPFAPINAWVKRNITADEKVAKGITYAIMNDIAKNGIPPRDFLQPIMLQAFQKLEKQMGLKVEIRI